MRHWIDRAPRQEPPSARVEQLTRQMRRYRCMLAAGGADRPVPHNAAPVIAYFAREIRAAIAEMNRAVGAA